MSNHQHQTFNPSRTVTQYDEPVANINGNGVTAADERVINDTWETRFNAIMSDAGYNTGRKNLKSTSVDSWVRDSRPAYWFIDAAYFYYPILERKLYVDFTRLKRIPKVQGKFNYFSLFSPNRTSAYRLFTLLQQDGFNLITRPHVPRYDVMELEGWEAKRIIKFAEKRAMLITMAPEIVVNLMRTAYDADPEMDHAVILSDDMSLLPAIAELRRLDIQITLPLLPNREIGNYFLSQMTHLIDLQTLLEKYDIISSHYSAGPD